MRRMFALAGLAYGLATSGTSRADDLPYAVEMAPASTGRLGTWLVLGPFRSSTYDRKSKPKTAEALTTAPPGVDELQLAPSKGSTPFGAVWTLAKSAQGGIDLKSLFKTKETDLVAYAAGLLRVTSPGSFLLFLGADDGVQVSVDGKTIFSRDESRPARSDDDVIPLTLAAGDHPIVIKFHQRDGGWGFTARITTRDFLAPRGLSLVLPGTTQADAAMLAQSLGTVRLDRGVRPDGYAPKVTVQYAEGAPRGVPLAVHAKVGTWFDASAGEISIDERGVRDFTLTLPVLRSEDLGGDEDRDASVEITVAGNTTRFPFLGRKQARAAIAKASQALEGAQGIPALSIDSVAYLRDRLADLVSRGDNDVEALRTETRELDSLAQILANGGDPYRTQTGPMRRAYRSALDGSLSEFGLYVPKTYRPNGKRTYPLIVALHGLNGHPMAIMRWVFGDDDQKRDQAWEDRHLHDFAPLDAFVLAPSAFGNSMYRHLGEEDAMAALDRVMAAYPIDADRVTITGPSMGGIGAAALPLHQPDRFAAALPLCGYHSYFVRRDLAGRPIRPWERFLAEERSNTEWALNGRDLPLWIVHGTQDTPVENSGALIEKYESLRYAIKHDHPDLGHNVWQPTYEDGKGAKWLLRHQRVSHPRTIDFRTARLRFAKRAWLEIVELASPQAWGEVHARVATRGRIDVTTLGVQALRIARDPVVIDDAVSVRVDGTTLAFPPTEPIELHKADGSWLRGLPTRATPYKRGRVTGPLRDVFHEPIVFVYGASDPAQTAANLETARAWAHIRPGVTVKYPLMSDTEFMDRGESLDAPRALFLVGNAQSNQLVRSIEAELPIRIEGASIVAGAERFTGGELGAAFVVPNPRRPDQYLVVVEGTDALGTWRSLSLPDLIPDFVVYDARLAPARGQVLLSGGTVLAAGFFHNDWTLPTKMADPLAHTARPPPKSEYDATPYLP